MRETSTSFLAGISTLDGAVLRSVRPYGGPAVDVTIGGGRIQSICSPREIESSVREIDAGGLILLPGLVDLHTHLREPGGEEAETIATGTRAAAAGGYTDVFAMANTDPVTDTVERVRDVAARSASSASARVHPVGAITTGLAGTTLTDLPALARAGASLFSDDGKCVDDAGLMFQALRIAATHDLVLAQHAQLGQIAAHGQINAGSAVETTGLPAWHAAAEETVIARDAILAGHTGAKLHICHISTRGSVQIIRWAKAQNWNITCEVTPHHLLLTDELAALSDPKYKVNPPLRAAEDVAALHEALRDGTIDAVATDHAPHTATAKQRHWCDSPFGMTALETALPVVARVLSTGGRMDWKLLADLMAHRPARIGGIAHVAGRPIAAGESATFTLVDPARPFVVEAADFHSRSTNSPFLGKTFHHRVIATALNGHLTHTSPEFTTIGRTR